MKKTKSKSPVGTGSELPRLRQAFQKPAMPGLACPEPEQVISSALQELAAPKQQEVQNHLLNCRDCLELYLDVRLARAEADSSADWKFDGQVLEEKPRTDWLAVLGHKVRETLRLLGKPKRLVPALAAVSLVVLVVIWGREERSKMLPPPQFAEPRPVAPTTPPSAAPSQEPAASKPLPAPPSYGLLAARPQAETAASFKRKSTPATGALSEPIRLDFSEVPANGARLSYRANRDAYAYLLRQDQNGKINLLYSGGLEAGKTYYYPVQDHLLKSDAATTKATVFLVASPSPVTDLEIRLKELERLGKDQMKILFPRATIRSLSVRLP